MKKYIPHLIVFISSMSVMIVELAASRIISKYFGNSLYTWTGVIGIVLGGISLGNYIGGRLADRYAPRALVRPLLLVSAVLVVAVLVLDAGLQTVLSGGNPELTWSFLARTVAGIAVLFLLPASALGTISPVMAKYALEDTGRIGTTVGNIYAVSSIGSIVGTFLSGFVLIPLFGTRTIILVVSAALAALTFLAGGKRRYGVAAAGILTALLATTVILPGTAEEPRPGAAADREPGDETVLYRKDTRYSNLTVKEIRRPSGTERVLIMDGLIHNRYDPSDPDILLYEYERIFRVLTEHLNEGLDSGLRTLTIGGGALTFPYYLERHFDPAENVVVELDPEVIEIAHRWFEVPRGTGMRTVAADGRSWVAYAAGEGRQFEIVYLDAFSSFSIPYHLTTREFTRSVARLLAPGGLVLANCIDIFSVGKFLSAYLNTMRTVFPEVAVYVTPNTSYEHRATFVIAATGRGPLPETLADRSGAVRAARVPAERLAELSARNGAVVLTDTYAPVENLIAPVFLRSVR